MVEHLRLFGQSHDLARSGVQLSMFTISLLYGGGALARFGVACLLVCLSGSCLLSTVSLYSCQRAFASVFFAFLHFQRFAQCGAIYIVQVATLCTAGQVRGWAGACVRVGRITGAFLGRSGRV